METAAERIVGSAREAISRSGRFTWVLSGGSTPRRLYTLLASARFAGRVDWAHVHFFWGDERCVPPDDVESNYRMARETLLDAVRPPPENVHRILGEAEPSRAAARYEQVLRELFRAREDAPPPRFDLVLLGMGPDGHTASLFPRTAPLFEKTRWVMANHVEDLASWRVTLTPVIINVAAQVVFLVVGPGKADRLKQVLQGESDVAALPAQLIQPAPGELIWLVDADAAARLEPRS